MLTTTTVFSCFSKLLPHPDQLYCKCTSAAALCRIQAKPRPNKTMSLVCTATGGWTFSRQTSNNMQAYLLGDDLYITWYFCSIRQHMQLEEIPFIWMAGCLGNCSRASSSFQQRKIIDWIPPQTGQMIKGTWPRGCPSLLSHCHSRDVQEEAECACESRPSGKSRSGNSVEPVALTISDSLGRLHKRFEVRLVIFLWNANPRVPRMLLFLQDRLWVPENMHDKGNGTLTTLISEQRIRPRLTLDPVCRLDWSWTHNPTDLAA